MSIMVYDDHAVYDLQNVSSTSDPRGHCLRGLPGLLGISGHGFIVNHSSEQSPWYADDFCTQPVIRYI